LKRLNIEELRQHAEQIIKNSDDKSAQFSKDDYKELLHELNVHQVELELQNHELQASNRALGQSRQAYKDLFDFAPIAYFVKSKSGKIEDANHATSTLLGLPRADMIGQSFTEFVHRNDQDTYYLHLQHLFSKSDKSSCEVQLDLGSEGYLDVRITSQRLKDESRVRCAVIDITPIQMAKRELADLLEQQQQMNHLYKRVVSSLLHEMRTPLAIIQTSTEMIDRYRNRLGEEAVEKRFSRIYDNIQYLESVVQEMVIAQDHGVVDDSVPKDDQLLVNMVEPIIENWRDGTQTIHLEDSLPDDMKIAQWSTPTITRILYNLISNAMKYSDEDIVVSLSSQENNVAITVEDKGRGIPPEDIPHLFEMMYRGENVYGTRGTGIGLYTVQRTVEKLEGTVDIRSEIGQGTSVTVRLPYR